MEVAELFLVYGAFYSYILYGFRVGLLSEEICRQEIEKGSPQAAVKDLAASSPGRWQGSF